MTVRIPAHKLTSVLFRGAGASFGVRVVGVVIALGAQIALARVLSTGEYGIYVYIIQVVGILATVGSLGFNQAAVRVIPETKVEADSKQRNFFIYSGVYVTVLVLSGIAVVMFLSKWFWNGELPEPFETVLSPITLLLLGALVLLRLGQEFMRGHKRIIASQIGEQVIVPLTLLLFAGLIWIFGSFLTAETVIIFQLSVVALCAGFLIKAVIEPCQGRSRYLAKPWTHIRNWLVMGIPLAFASLMSTFLSRGDLILLGFLVSTEDIAAYAAAARIAGLMVFGLAAVNAIAAPLFSELWHSEQQEELQEQVNTSVSMATLVTLPIFALLIIFPEKVLLLFGQDFVAGAQALRILSVGQLVNAIMGPVGPLMLVTNQQNFYAVATLLGIFVTVISVIVFEHFFGLAGAAAGTMIGLIFLNTLLARRIYLTTRLRTVASPGLLLSLFTRSASSILSKFRSR